MNLKLGLKTLVLGLLLASQGLQAAYDAGNIKKMRWNDMEVVWLQDERFPTYQVMFYFADGALSDRAGKAGETTFMFDLLDAGTTRYSAKDISDELEFYGVQWASNVTHEYSTFSISGLVKDRQAAMTKICHLFQDANYPKAELVKAQILATNALKGLINNHSALATMAARQLSLAGTPFSVPAEGNLKSIAGLNSDDFKAKKKYFNERVTKRIYISGPKEMLDIENTIVKDCGWKGSSDQFVRVPSFKYERVASEQPAIYLVTVPEANQAQVRWAQFLTQGEYENEELMNLASQLLGGGFTAKLMREIRVKRGLSYSVSSFAGGQKTYGRAGISTFTKNPTLAELIKVTQDTVTQAAQGDFTDEEFTRARGSLVGSFPFRFEDSAAYLGQLLFLDHVGKSYDFLATFQDKVMALDKAQVASMIGQLYAPNRQVLIVVGPANLESVLKPFGKVKLVPYQSIL